MGKLNITENLFLEKAELLRMQDFQGRLGWQRAMKALVKQYGIVLSEENSFRVIVHPSLSQYIKIYPGLAYTPDMEAIYSGEEIDIFVGSAVDTIKWVVLSRAVSHTEEGTVAVATDGSLTGFNTKFTEVLRGQPNFPTKIRFTDSVANVHEYEVVRVISDTSAILSGTFTAESELKYSVVGTFTPGYVPSDEDKNLYHYDSCSIQVITSDAMPTVEPGQYVIARIDYSSVGQVTIYDLRAENAFSDTPTINEDAESQGANPCVSLLSVRKVGGWLYQEKTLELELIAEFAYFITSFEASTTTANAFFRINAGQCNTLPTIPSQIADGTFNGFILLNRKNMVSAKIVSQEADMLTLEPIDLSKLIGESGGDFIIIPDFTNFEINVTADSDTYQPSIPFVLNGDLAQGRARMRVWLDYPNSSTSPAVTLTLKYRMYSANHSGVYTVFNTAIVHDQLKNLDYAVAGGLLTIDIAALIPSYELRNYS